MGIRAEVIFSLVFADKEEPKTHRNSHSPDRHREDGGSKDVNKKRDKSMENPQKQESTNMELGVSINHQPVQVCTFTLLICGFESSSQGQQKHPRFAAKSNSSPRRALTPSNNALLQYMHTKHNALLKRLQLPAIIMPH